MIRALKDLEGLSYILEDHGDSYVCLTAVRSYTHKTRWAIRYFGNCMSKDGLWSIEPQPSSRTDEWLDHHRFDTPEEAIAVFDKYGFKYGFKTESE